MIVHDLEDVTRLVYRSPLPLLEPETSDEQQGIDWALVATLRSQASDQLSAAIGGDRGLLGRAAQEELGRSTQ